MHYYAWYFNVELCNNPATFIENSRECAAEAGDNQEIIIRAYATIWKNHTANLMMKASTKLIITVPNGIFSRPLSIKADTPNIAMQYAQRHMQCIRDIRAFSYWPVKQSDKEYEVLWEKSIAILFIQTEQATTSAWGKRRYHQPELAVCVRRNTICFGYSC